MRLSRPTLPSSRMALQYARRTGRVLTEAAVLVAFVAAIEFAGPYAQGDAMDLVVLAGAVLMGILIAQAARAGWMPMTSRAASALMERGKGWVRQLSPRYAVAFRPTASASPLPDRTLLRPILVIAALATALLALGPALLGALTDLKTYVSYTLYLTIMGVIWSVLFLTTCVAARVAGQWLAEKSRERGGGSVRGPLVVFALLWFGAFALTLMLPGLVPLLVLLALGWMRGRSLADIPARTYLFCRRDAEGRARAVPVHEYLRRVHSGMLALLALVVVLGQLQRLWTGGSPENPYAFTTWLGILASLCAVLLVTRAGTHFKRLLGGGGIPPEVPLTPTLWIRTPQGAVGAGDPWGHSEAWYRLARENGWLVLREGVTPDHEYDLVMGLESDARKFLPRPPFDETDARIQLERRLHVVLRRRFHRHLRGLFKKLKGETPEQGSGFLFCPHIWLVPGVVRDVEPGSRGEGEPLAAAFYGPPYAVAFPHRVRRYVGSILRALEVDIIYWEDALTWTDLRRVLGVAYEIHDQQRAPLLERHFLGLPRVRVLIQEEAAEPEPSRSWMEAGNPTFSSAASGHARILLVLRDRGKEEESVTPDPADTWIKTPSLV